MRSKVLTAMKMSVLIFWVVTPYGFVGKYQLYEGTYCFHLHGWRWKQYVSPSGWYLSTSPHGVTTQIIE